MYVVSDNARNGLEREGDLLMVQEGTVGAGLGRKERCEAVLGWLVKDYRAEVWCR